MSSLFSLTKTELALLTDGYTRKIKRDNQYIAIELCNLIILCLQHVFHFFIIFEKGSDRWTQRETNELLCFNIENKEKSIIENECWAYVNGCSYCVEYNNKNNKYNIYRIGGSDNDNNIHYEINNNKIIKLPNLLKERLGLSSIYCEKYGLFAIGGWKDNSVEILNNNNNCKWKYAKSMNDARRSHDSIIINDKIFVCGGFDDDNCYLQSCEMYNMNTNTNTNDEWKYIENMNYERCYLSLQKLKEKNNNIIAIGGFDNHSKYNIVEEYDFLKQKWYELPNTIDKHKQYCGIYIFNNIIYVFGDAYRVSNDNFGICEMYDIREEKWSKMDQLSNLFHFTIDDCKKRYFHQILYVK